MKKIIIGIIGFIIGIGVSIFLEGFFREQIQNIFQWTTSNRIMFIGKNFYIMSSAFYYLSFGITILIFSLTNFNNKTNKILKNGVMMILIFGVLLFGISAIDANLKVIECTACIDGIRKLHWNDINYGTILGISAIISILPSLIKIIMNRKKPAYNNS